MASGRGAPVLDTILGLLRAGSKGSPAATDLEGTKGREG